MQRHAGALSNRGCAAGHSASCSRQRLAPAQAVSRGSSVVFGGKTYIDPVANEVSAFAPATVANLGPGFDWMGCAVQAGGDVVTAKALRDKPGQLIIEKIEGDNGRLTLDPTKNCIGVAAAETLKLLGQPTCGVSLTLHKGLPLGSGMGSSAASAAAAAWAVNGLFGGPLTKDQLVGPCVSSEAAVSGYHADNVAPSLLGGFVMVRRCTPGEPIDLMRVPFTATDRLWFVLVNPLFEAPTAQMRAVLPKQIPMKQVINNCCQGGSLVAGIITGDIALLGSALDSDAIVEPVRAPLMPGMLAVKEAAKKAGAFGCTISGAGPTAVAIVDNPETGEKVMWAMCNAFRTEGKLEVNSAKVVKLDPVGATLK